MRNLVMLNNRNFFPSLWDNTDLFSDDFKRSFHSWEDNETSYSLDVEIPGVKKDQIKIETKDNYVLISAEKQIKQESFKLSGRYSIPKDANVDSLEASLEDGVLKLVLKKKENAPAKLISIK